MARILFIAPKPYFPWEGACHRTRHTLEALAALGHSVDLLTPPTGHLPTQTNITVLPLQLGRVSQHLPPHSLLRSLLMESRTLLKTLALMGRNPYDLTHGVDTGGIIAWMTARLTKLPFIFEHHKELPREHIGYSNAMRHSAYRMLERKALAEADAIIGNNTDVVNLATPLGRRSRVCVIPDIPAISDTVPQTTLNLAQARYRTAPDQKLVTCVGSYTRFQGLDLFFNALPRLLTNQPDTRIVVVGGSDQEIARMQHALQTANLAGRVAFPGRISIEDLAALLAISDVLVSSRRAGTTAPIKVLDYLYSGTPIVAVDTPANRTILSTDNAVLTRPTPENLADSIINVLRASPPRRYELGQQGRRTLKQAQRTPEAFKKAIEHCYAYVLPTT